MLVQNLLSTLESRSTDSLGRSKIVPTPLLIMNYNFVRQKIEKIMNEFSTNVSTLIQQRRTMMKKNYSLNPLIIRVQFLGLQIAPRKINVENDLAKKNRRGLAPSLEVHLDRIIKVLWQQDASKGMQQYFFLFFVCKFGLYIYIFY